MGNQDDIEQKFMDFRKKQTLFIAASFIVNAAVVMLLCLYYNFKQRALTGALYLYDKTAAENYLDVLSKMKITQAVGRYVNEGNAAIEKIGYGSKGYSYIFLLSGEIWIYIIALLILSVIFICGMVSIRSMTAHSVIADALAVKERNIILENRLKQENEYNKKQQRKMQDFIENIAHQIKTPLAAIILNLEFMQELHMDERMGRLVDESAGSAFRIRDFIRTLLNISRFENKKVIIAADEVIIGSIITDSINNCMNCIIHENQNDIFIVQYDDKCESAVIYADEMWLVEAIANVIGNSADYIKNIPDGKVYITAGCDERKVVIRIEDNGKGLTVKDQDDIFDRFSTTRNSASDMHVGLGLNLSRLIIEAHYGIIKAGNSEEYGGAEFTIILPRYRLKDKR
ncbi:MAG TPA: sensor histidine kinase [Eubacterium sp.]|jgi:signal transduction histidine kinase|nr:sensor histidine kinase [Eubacterium sp.]